jgi:hypothetical protein
MRDGLKATFVVLIMFAVDTFVLAIFVLLIFMTLYVGEDFWKR